MVMGLGVPSRAPSEQPLTCAAAPDTGKISLAGLGIGSGCKVGVEVWGLSLSAGCKVRLDSGFKVRFRNKIRAEAWVQGFRRRSAGFKVGFWN